MCRHVLEQFRQFRGNDVADSLQQPPAAGTRVDEEVEQFDAIIIGAGVAGLYQLYSLRQLGLSVRLFEDGEWSRRHLVLESLPGMSFRLR